MILKKLNYCFLCGSPDLEKVSDKLRVCKKCGFGYGNTGHENYENFWEHLQNIKDNMNLLRRFFPNDTERRLLNKYLFHEHRIKKHETTKDGYCEFCERNWEKLSDNEFHEQLGYQKSFWMGKK